VLEAASAHQDERLIPLRARLEQEIERFEAVSGSPEEASVGKAENK
jgi:hypothetical protein